METYNIEGILADIGVSSLQLDKLEEVLVLNSLDIRYENGSTSNFRCSNSCTIIHKLI